MTSLVGNVIQAEIGGILFASVNIGKRDKILNYQMCKHSIVYFSFMLYCIVKTLN